MINGNYNQWDIWTANVKFEDTDEIKARPVLIFTVESGHVYAFKITKHEPRPEFEGECRLNYWESAHLRMPSTVRLSKLLELSPVDFRHRIGRLHPRDIIEIVKQSNAMFS